MVDVKGLTPEEKKAVFQEEYEKNAAVEKAAAKEKWIAEQKELDPNFVPHDVVWNALHKDPLWTDDPRYAALAAKGVAPTIDCGFFSKGNLMPYMIGVALLAIMVIAMV